MNRVSTAARRAAEQSGESITRPPLAGVVPAEDIDALAREPYPVERTEPGTPDAEVHSRSDVAAATSAPVEALPRDKPMLLLERMDARLREKVVVDANMNSASREQYRRVAAALHHAQARSGLKVLMVASATVGEGKTLTAANLALTFSESYQRSVLLLDADLRRPCAHVVFGIEPSPGLNDGLMATDHGEVHAVFVSERLAVLPAGRPTSDPMAGLTSERMRRIVREARESFDWVIIDTPPVTLLPDANLLAAVADGAVLVVKAGATAYDLVVRAVEAIGRDRIVGVVLNQATTAPHSYGYDRYYGYYSSTTP
jgi:protein-tyrosine kinase